MRAGPILRGAPFRGRALLPVPLGDGRIARFRQALCVPSVAPPTLARHPRFLPGTDGGSPPLMPSGADVVPGRSPTLELVGTAGRSPESLATGLLRLAEARAALSAAQGRAAQEGTEEPTDPTTMAMHPSRGALVDLDGGHVGARDAGTRLGGPLGGRPAVQDGTFAAGHTVVAVTGELDVQTAGAFGRVLEGATRPGCHLVVDFAQLTFIDASGLGQLSRAHTRLREVGGRLAVTSPSAMTYKVLELTGFTEILSVERPVRPEEGTGHRAGETASALVDTSAPLDASVGERAEGELWLGDDLTVRLIEGASARMLHGRGPADLRQGAAPLGERSR